MAGLRKQIKDYNAVATPAGNDKIPAQQTADNVVRYMTPLQIINLYATTFGKSLIDDADATAGRNTLAALGTGDLATQADVETGTDNAKWISKLWMHLRTHTESPELLQKDGEEQQLAPVRHVWRKFPNTETACLKYVTTAYLTQSGDAAFGSTSVFDNPNQTSATNLITTAGGSLGTPAINEITTNAINYQGYDYTTPLLLQFRMTSPYNIWKTYGTVDLNSGANYSNGQPAWLELFDQKYQYYHVMETEWEITFNFGLPNNGTNNATNAQNKINVKTSPFCPYAFGSPRCGYPVGNTQQTLTVISVESDSIQVSYSGNPSDLNNGLAVWQTGSNINIRSDIREAIVDGSNAVGQSLHPPL